MYQTGENNDVRKEIIHSAVTPGEQEKSGLRASMERWS